MAFPSALEGRVVMERPQRLDEEAQVQDLGLGAGLHRQFQRQE
jgi:hypothetical protein